ncbi:MAG TPA: RDD family protein [Thermoanaerobaculia bacterium]|nr:RDD family protein [Thermoanaerobaculia bacterium]
MEIASLNLSADAAPPTPYAHLTLDYVGFGKRCGARIIDFVVHFGVALVSGFTAGILVLIYAMATHTSAEPLLAKMGSTGVLAFILSLFGSVLYDSIMEGLHGSTIGKLMLGIVVLREDGRPCTYVQAVGRSFAFFLDSLFFGLVAHTSMRDSPRLQRYGDKWAGTVVVTRVSVPPHMLRGAGRFVGVMFLALFADAVALIAGTLA